jgi:hypothetical protein
MDEGVNEAGTRLFRATVYEFWVVSHSPYLWRNMWRGAILEENNIIVFREDLTLPFLQGMERF